VITYTDVSSANINGVQFRLNGDGTSTVLKINLSKPPFNVAFSGVLPAAVSVTTNQFGLTATGAITLEPTDAFLTITFNAAPPVANVAPEIKFIYNSL
jgi:hypothetical protein